MSGLVVQMTSLCTQISGSDEKALDKSFCEKYFMTTKRNCMSSLPFEDRGSHGSTLKNSRPSVHAQFFDFKSRSLRITRNLISRTRSELSAPSLCDFSHHAPVYEPISKKVLSKQDRSTYQGIIFLVLVQNCRFHCSAISLIKHLSI